MEVEQEANGKRVRNDRHFFCPTEDASLDEIEDVADLVPRVKEELERFFVAGVVANTDKKLRFLGWKDAAAAIAGVRAGEHTFARKTR